MSNRVKRISINPEMFSNAFREGLQLKILKGVPKDAIFRGFGHDIMSNSIVIFYEHESFPEVEDHKIPDLLDLMIETTKEE